MSEGHFEAKVSAKRETSAGIFLTLQVQPDDYTEALSMLRVGSALQVGWAEIRDVSVQPIVTEPDATPAGAVVAEKTGVTARRDGQPKQRWEDMPASKQAGIRCSEARFQAFLRTTCPQVVKLVHPSVPDDEVAAEVVRIKCGVPSRSVIDGNPTALERWQHLESRYQQYLLDSKYADAVR